MNIVHELNQCECGGVEKVIRNIVKYDKINSHEIIAYKGGRYLKELEKYAKVHLLTSEEQEVDMAADLLHIHSGGAISNMALRLGETFPVIETIHSPIRSVNPDKFISQRVGVTKAVSDMNKNCQTILNGIDFEDCKATHFPEEIKFELGVLKNTPVIGRLGRLGEDKGLVDWLLTCYYLQQKGLNFIPLIVGDISGSKESKKFLGKLKLMCACLPVKNVVWVGHRNTISNYMQIMDIFLYPSLTEGFGLVFIEALYNGCNVVTYKTPVTSELLAGYASLTDVSRGIPGLVERVEKLLNNSELMDSYSGIGHDWAISEYQVERMVKQYQEIYERYNGHFDRKNNS